MKFASRCRPVALSFIAAASMLWLAAPASRAEGAAKAPGTLAEQLGVLSSALAESFNTGDWEMLEMVVEGAKAAGLKDSGLEIFALGSERDAALSVNPTPHRTRIVLWGLAFRAKVGDDKALTALRAKAEARPAPVERPQGGGLAAAEAWRAWQRYQLTVAEKNEALLTLALLGEKSAGSTAWEALQSEEASAGPGAAFGAMGQGTSTLAMAVLAAEGEAGWKKLVGFCTPNGNDANGFSSRVAVLGGLAALVGHDRPGNRAGAFKLEGKLASTLPADAAATLRSAFVALAGSLPETETANFGILYTAGLIPGLAEDEAGLQALKSLKGRCKTNAARQWDATIDRLINPLAQPGRPALGPSGNHGQGDQVEKF